MTRINGIIFFLFISSALVHGGTLGDFEAQSSRKEEKESAKEALEEEGDGSDTFLEFLIQDIFWQAFLGGGVWSWERVCGGGDPRSLGEAAIPFFRVDASFQDVRSDVVAVDTRLEMGYGPFAVQGRRTRYAEKDPRDRLTLSHVQGLYRMSFTRHVEVDLGLGSLSLDGKASHSGTSVSIPVHLFISRNLGVEYRPVWGWLGGVPVNDYDLSCLLLGRGWTVRGGYRWVRTGEAHLDGPYVGLSFHY